MPALGFKQTKTTTETKPPARKPGKRFAVAKRRARKVVEVTHRWVSFGLGIALLAVVLSGVVLTWGPEIHEIVNSDQYDGTDTGDPITYSEAFAAVEEEKPNFTATEALRDGDVYSVYNASYLKQAHVDAGTGEVLGVSTYDTGFMGLMRNMHFCALSCKDYPGYVPFLNDRVKDSFVPSFGNPGLTWGGLLLGVTGLMLIFLSLGGIWLWWPSIKRFSRGFKIRRSNRYKFQYDLHKVVGIAAIPFLLMWGVTGAGFELKQVHQAWYAIMPGDEPEASEFDTLVSNPKEKRAFEPEARDGKVTLDEASAIGARVAGGDSKQVSIIPAEGKKGTYSMYFANGSDPYEYGHFPGDLGISVDRYSGQSVINYPANLDSPIGEMAWEEWNYPVHAGFFANPFWRVFWGVFGLAVLLLAVTSTITWWIRWRKKRAKGKRASRELASEAAQKPV